MTRAAQPCYLPLPFNLVLLRTLSLAVTGCFIVWMAKGNVSKLSRVEQRETYLSPFKGSGVMVEPRLRGLGHAEKGAVRPWFLDCCPVAIWCLNLKLSIL